MEEGWEELAHGIAKPTKNRDAQGFDITRIESDTSKMGKEIKPWWIGIDAEEHLTKKKVNEDALYV